MPSFELADAKVRKKADISKIMGNSIKNWVTYYDIS
jgi:hypothetical protein